MSEELSKVYESQASEKLANELWFSKRCFHAEPDTGPEARKSYTIVIPPPNVTAPLHLGHALNNTLQDILIRFRRMQGFNTLWMPGTDHAGIATQTVVEKRLLSEQKKRRTDFEREEFVGHVQAWKDEYEVRIIEQLKAMGCSCDWDRTRFTMDPVCAKAVRATFFKLFRDGLIYRGKRLVNWDPVTQTVLADDEVEHETVQGHFWYMSYPLVEPVEIEGNIVEHVTVATTRPETMLGDTAIAMNPSDPRAEYLLGRDVCLPIVGRIIPIIADEHVVLPDPQSDDEKAKYSTGFLKVTPAHDPDDWQIGQRHGLEIVNVMAPDGTISDKYGWGDARGTDAEFLLGMDRFEAREGVVEWFRQEKLLQDVREYVHEVGHSYRSHVPIEPYLSDQWYIAVKKPIEYLSEKFGTGLIEGTDVPVNSLAGLALEPLLDKTLRFIPDRYAKTYQSWLENLRDWPISRQLWWGHRIPIWTLVFTSAHGQSLYELDDAYEQEFVKDLNKVFRECGFAEGDDYIIRQWLADDGNLAIYCCGHNKRFDKALSLLSKIRTHRTKPWDELVRQENDEFKQEFGVEAFGLGNELCGKIVRIHEDEDVLDTWFSSALWPFSTLGWPDDSPELQTFYPGDVLCTAREIITLWVSRMVMMGQYCVGDIPFSDVFIHAMIQDGQGRKMSKSLGNGIDPLVVISSHGADAMRFTLASMTTLTQDVRMPVQKMKLPDGRGVNTSPKFDIGRNFCNKLWNASRFALGNLEGVDEDSFDAESMTLADRWILSRLAQTIDEVTDSLEEFKFSEPLNLLYRFFWNDFCDWYLEWTKPRMQDDLQRPIAQNVLAFVLDQILRLLHPFVPFITEGIFQKLNEVAPVRGLKGIAEAPGADVLVVADWPGELNGMRSSVIEQQISVVQETIRAIRDIRSKYNKPPSEVLKVSARAGEESADILKTNAELINQLGQVELLEASTDISKPTNAAVTIAAESIELYVHDVIDPAAERQRLQKQKEQLVKAKNGVEIKLGNENFVNKAKSQVVTQAKARLTELTEQLETVEKHLSELGV